LYPRHRLDISVRDLIFGLSACLWAWRRRKLAADVALACPAEDDVVVCLSVRSGFGLLLREIGGSPGDEVLVSAVTHPDMVRIVEERGMRAVPVDLEIATLAPRIEALEAEITPRTRAVMVAHLFGGRVDLGPIAALARRHGLLLLIEDCAQAFRGPDDLGDPLADVSMFSFGPIKTASAGGGAIFRVGDPLIRERMLRAQEDWPVQRRIDYAARLLKLLCLILAGHPLPYGFIVRACGRLGRDLDTLVNGATRAFTSSGDADRSRDELFSRLRRRPSAPLLALLARRLRTYDAARLSRRAAAGEEVARRLPALFRHPGSQALGRTHWLFPVVAPDPEALISALRRYGFDASQAASNIAAVRTPGLPRPEEASRMMSGVVFLPVYPELPEEALRRLTQILEQAAGAGERPIESLAIARGDLA